MINHNLINLIKQNLIHLNNQEMIAKKQTLFSDVHDDIHKMKEAVIFYNNWSMPKLEYDLIHGNISQARFDYETDQLQRVFRETILWKYMKDYSFDWEMDLLKHMKN